MTDPFKESRDEAQCRAAVERADLLPFAIEASAFRRLALRLAGYELARESWRIADAGGAGGAEFHRQALAYSRGEIYGLLAGFVRARLTPVLADRDIDFAEEVHALVDALANPPSEENPE